MDELLKRREGGVEILTLNRPAKRNALSQTLIQSLHRSLRDAFGDGGVRGVVVTGTPPVFSAGLDLDEVSAASGDERRLDAMAGSLFDLLVDIDESPKPVISAIQGSAVAGGAALAGVCDVAVAGRSVSLGFPGIRRGLVAPVIMPFVVQRVGEHRARYLLLTGALLSAGDTLGAGLVDEVVDDERVAARALVLADQLAASPRAYGETKRRLRAIESRGGSPGLGRHRASCARLIVAEDAGDGGSHTS